MRRPPRYAPILAIACVAGATLASLVAPPAQATVGPPVRITLDRPSGPAEPGRAWRGRFRVTAGRAAEVSEFRLEASGWSQLELASHGTVSLAAGEGLDVTFSGVPSADDAPITLVLYASGHEVRQTFVLSRKLWEQTAVGGPDRELPASRARPASLEGRRTPQVVAAEPRPEPAADPERPAGAPARRETMTRTEAARSITVTGRIVYTRPDGIEVPVDGATVRAYDEDIVNWQLGSADVTGSDGRFSISFTWDPCPYVCDQDPDIFIEYEAANSRVHVHPPIGFNFKWKSGTKYNRTSNNVDFGDRTPSDESQHRSLHMLTTVTRAWRWLRDYESSYNPPDVGVMWTDPTIPGGGYYLFGDIHMGAGRDSMEATVVHEYGHHWVANYADFNQLPDYCNGICDDGFGICGHCGYCQESGSVALQEGFPNWFSEVILRRFEQDYGIAPVGIREFEFNSLCQDIQGDDCDCDPLRTEGFFSGLLRDLEDGTATVDDPLQERIGPYPAPGDEMSDSHATIFDIMDDNSPGTPQEFFDEYLSRRSDQKSSMWATAKLNTYEFDTTNPGQVSGLASNSHTVNVSSGDHTIEAHWSPASDNLSGIAFYVVTFTQNGPCRPGVSPNGCTGFLGPDTVRALPTSTATSGTLPNGNWYVNVLAVDRALREGTNYRSLGPFVLRVAEPANLRHALTSGWAHEVLPRSTSDATVFNCPDPTALNPTVNGTWLNVSGENNGEQTVSTGFDVALLVDGVEVLAPHAGEIPPGGYTGRNLGPITVGSGRHTVEGFMDCREVVPETDEDDNELAYQWVWAPPAVSAPLTQLHSTPPPPMIGGWDAMTTGAYYNCDGVRFNMPTTDWFVATVFALDDTTDYDCRVHSTSTGPTSGFAVNLGFSSRGQGCTDAVLVNRDVATGTAYDIGVLNQNESNAAYRLSFLKASPFTFGDSSLRTISLNVALQALQFDVPSAQWVTLDLRHLSGPAPLHLRLFNRTLGTGDLDDDLGEIVVDSLGHGFLSANLTTGSYCAVVFRDAKDGLSSAQYTLEIGPTPPDFEPVKPTGWAAALVPRPTADGTATTVATPDTLHGNAALTFLNLAVRNDSPASSPAWNGQVLVDDVLQLNLNYPATPGSTNLTFNGTTPHNIRGGRHTLTARLDPSLAVEELIETGNHTGSQWIWSPLALSFGTAVTRLAPPARTGGLSDVTSGSFWFNCDGLRMPAPSASTNWACAAVLPGPKCDYDVRLHERGDGATSGFSVNLGYSGWDEDQSDFVLVNYTQTTRRALDAGVLGISGTTSYLAEAQQSSFLASDPDATFGNFSIGANNLVRLHEVRLAKNRTYRVTLLPLSGAVDWGVSIFRGDRAYFDKSGALGSAWTEAAGQSESFNVTAPDTGTYCVVVWKASSSDAGVAGSYRLDFARSSVDVPGLPAPGVTRLAVPYPNPANADANIAFELARASTVALEIFDLAGSRVRTLRTGLTEPGRHVKRWDRLDDRGRPVPTGVYWVRFAADGVTDSRKLVLIR